MVPSSVSVVYTDDMVEVRADPHLRHAARLPALTGRHAQYSACMMNDELVEIDADSMAVARQFMLKPGAEHGMSGPPGGMAAGGTNGHDMGPPKPGDVGCSPTWAQPSADGRTALGGVQQGERHRGDRRRLVGAPPPHPGRRGDLQPGREPRTDGWSWGRTRRGSRCR